MSNQKHEVNCPDCKEFIDQILELKTILKDNNEKMSIVEIGKDVQLEELEEMLSDAQDESIYLWKLLKIEKERND